MMLWNTYYNRSNERDYPGPKDTGIYRSDGSLIKMVPRAFVTNNTTRDSGLCVEGSGILDDGRVVNYSSNCEYGPTCLTGGRQCYSVLDARQFPWGKGSHNNPLVPLHSIATCPREIPYGSYVYIPRWRGVQIPRVGDLGGFVHDGCFRADDTGGWICPRPGHNDPPGHIDIFAGSADMASALERIIPTRSQFEATISTTPCTTNPPTSSGLLVAGAVVLVGAAAWWWSKRARKNPLIDQSYKFDAPFLYDKTKTDTLVVWPSKILAYSPKAALRAARLVVERDHIPLSTYMTLTDVVAPLIGFDRTLTIELTQEAEKWGADVSGILPDDVIATLRSVGFRLLYNDRVSGRMRLTVPR